MQVPSRRHSSTKYQRNYLPHATLKKLLIKSWPMVAPVESAKTIPQQRRRSTNLVLNFSRCWEQSREVESREAVIEFRRQKMSKEPSILTLSSRRSMLLHWSKKSLFPLRNPKRARKWKQSEIEQLVLRKEKIKNLSLSKRVSLVKMYRQQRLLNSWRQKGCLTKALFLRGFQTRD